MSNDLILTPKHTPGGTLLEITLNRPHALNALTFDMCHTLYNLLSTVDQDTSIHALILRGAGEKAFCAGGDIRGIYHNGPTKQPASLAFFEQEYAMNKALFHLQKPCIALWDGITMGGGLGVSLYGSHRIATEKLLCAMPETGIGFFPDVGGTYFLSRLGPIGLFLGLTGARMGVADAIHLGLATHAVPHEALSMFQENLLTWPKTCTFQQHAADCLEKLPRLPLSVKLPIDKINAFFNVKTLSTLFDNLRKSDDPWAQEQLAILLQKSPTSLHITLTAFLKGSALSFDDAMDYELKLAESCLAGADFYEGIRAALVDKDQQPRWRPAPPFT